MAKIPKKLVNFRLPVERVFSIQEMADSLGVSQSEVVDRAVEFYETHSGGVESRVVISYPARHEQVSASLDDLREIVAPTAPTAPKSPAVIKRYRCGHHNGTELSVARVGDICAPCLESGHTGDVRECSECWQPA